MKKFWVALISIFVLAGGLVFTACNEKSVSMKLDTYSVEFCIDANKTVEDQVVVAQIEGSDDNTVSVHSGDSNIVLASCEPVPGTNRSLITLKVPEKENRKAGSTEVVVTSVADTTVNERIRVYVYSDILGMTEKTTDFNKGADPRYAIRGGEVELDYKKLIKFTNDTRDDARMDIEWRLDREQSNATIEGNVLKLDDNFFMDEIVVYAYALHNPELAPAQITLHVLDRIDADNIDITISNSQSTGFVDAFEEGQSLRIVPNMADMADMPEEKTQYTGYIKIAFSGSTELLVNPVVSGRNLVGKEYDNSGNLVDCVYNIIETPTTVGLPQTADGKIAYTFKVKALEQYIDRYGVTQYFPHINGDAFVAFDIKYSDYDYKVSSQKVYVAVYEKIKELFIQKDGSNISGEQTIYTSYANGIGQGYNIVLSPSTVVTKTGKFSITVDYPLTGIEAANTIDANTLIFSYRSPQGGRPVPIEMTGSGTTFTNISEIPEGVNQIYICAGEGVKTQVEKVAITFTSLDSPELAKQTMIANLYCSADSLTFTGDEDFNIVKASNGEGEQLQIVKTFTLSGQNSSMGLKAVKVVNDQYSQEGFEITENPFNIFEDKERNCVTFSIRITITKPGITTTGAYKIIHENGKESEVFTIFLFLPLTDVTLRYDTGTNSNNVTTFVYDSNMYIVEGETLNAVEGKGQSISNMLIKSGTAVDLTILQNYVTSTNPLDRYTYFANASVEFRFLDKTQENADDFDLYQASEIFNKSSGVSELVRIDINGHLSTFNKAGQVYLIALFTGLDDSGNEITYVRIVKIEVHIAMGVLNSTERTINLYTSVNDQDLSRKFVTIYFGENLVSDVSYDDFEYFDFESTIQTGKQVISKERILWNENYYNIDQISINGRSLSFYIYANSTNGLSQFNDVLRVEYNFYNISRAVTFTVNIFNAERVEKVEWLNSDKDGLYFALEGGVKEQVIVTNVLPSSAKDLSLDYYLFDTSGIQLVNNPFVEIDEDGFVRAKNQAGTGYIIVIPHDASNNGQIEYYYKTLQDGVTVENRRVISVGELLNSYDFLTENAYYKSNSNKEISFSDIIVRIPVTVADGSDWQKAYRLYDSADFWQLSAFGYYTVMNNVVLENWGSDGRMFGNDNIFYGGLQGASPNITITLTGNSKSFVSSLGDVNNNKGEIRNITFTGEVSGSGFVAEKNYGNIYNVTVDVFVVEDVQEQSSTIIKPSTVNAVGREYAGSIIGENFGNAQNVKALGVTVNGGTYVGGIAGYNENIIDGASFEIYNFKAESATTNILSGNTVGALVGFSSGGTITKSYAYDYTLTAENHISHVGTLSGKKGAFIGHLAKQTDISLSFAVVNVSPIWASAEQDISALPQDYYIAYYDDGGQYHVDFALDQSYNAENWVESGASGFYEYVNNGQKHLKNVYQKQALTVDEIGKLKLQTTSIDGKYYQAINVDATNAILFFYQVEQSVDLEQEEYAQQRNALLQLNTISLEKLFGSSVAERLSVISSDVTKLSVQNNQIVVKNTTAKAITLTLSSKQNYSISIEINIKIVYALSNISASWMSNDMQSTLASNSNIDLQRESQLTVVFGNENSEIYLGTNSNSVSPYKLMQGDVKFAFTQDKLESSEDGTNVIAPRINFSDNILIFDSEDNTQAKTKITTTLYLQSFTEDENNVVGELFAHNFTVTLYRGAISISLEGDTLPITPSQVAPINATLISNNPNDDLSIVVERVESNNVYSALSLSSDSNANTKYFKLGDTKQIVVNIQKGTPVTESGRTTIKYLYNFSIADEYKSLVSSLQEYRVTFYSNLQVKSASFTLKLDRQAIKSPDMNTYLVNAERNDEVSAGSTLYRLDTTQKTTGINPGKTVLLAVDMNPVYSYYDYFTLTVDGISNLDISLLYLERVSDAYSNYYVDKGHHAPITGGIIVNQVPTEEEDRARLVFAVWVHPELKQDADLKLCISFYINGQEEPILYQYQSLFVSYLLAPQVTVDNKTEGILLAKGASIDAQIAVSKQENIEITARLEGVERNIYLTKPERSEDGSLYTLKISADVNASVKTNSDTEVYDGVFYLYVKIVRVVNGLQTPQEQRIPIRLVNFVIDAEDVAVVGEEDEDNFVAYIDVPRALSFSYPIIPSNIIYDDSDSLQSEAYRNLRDMKTAFNNTGFYLGSENNDSEYYSINYVYDEDGENLVQSPLRERLWYRTSDGGWTNIWSSQNGYRSAGGYFTFSDGPNGTIMVTGQKLTQNGAVQFRLDTYIQNGSSSANIMRKEYIFTMQCKPYSSEELPEVIWDEDGFEDLRPNTESEVLDTENAQDYILMSDLVLDDWTPFSSNLIRSLDGNGYIIYINGFNLSQENSFNVALFNNIVEGTTLKNIKVNIYNAGQIKVDINKYKESNIAGFAITNSGTITNCEVGCFYREDYTSSRLPAGTKVGLNVLYTSGNGDNAQFMHAQSDWESRVAGFVIENRGNITNSRVGGDSMVRFTSEYGDRISSLNEPLETFNIVAQGSVAGFALTNNGLISSCYAKNMDMYNQAEDRDTFVSGFVGNNIGYIYSSYIEGKESNNPADAYCRDGSSLRAEAGIIAGFVYENGGTGTVNTTSIIKDCYSNILISNNRDEEMAYLASGFVYANRQTGIVENCYSASQVAASKYSQMNFTGVALDATVNNDGQFINNYFYSSEKYTDKQTDIETLLKTEVTKVRKPNDENYFYGFAFASFEGADDGVWIMEEDAGLKLVEANLIAVSHRYYAPLDTPNDQGKKYYLPYSYVQTADYGLVNTYYGSTYNPIIIRNAQEFNNVFGNSTASDISRNFDQYQITGTYRLVDNIDLGDLVTEGNESNFVLASSSRAFTGKFYGNGLTINGLSISASQTLNNTNNFAFGMFASVENAVLCNFNVTVRRVRNTQASVVGALAGLVRSSKIISISVSMEDEDSAIEGGNFVGGIAGMVLGDSTLRNITLTNANITTKRWSSSAQENSAVFNTLSAYRWRRQYLQNVGTSIVTKIDKKFADNLITYLDDRYYSYAGGLFAYVDVYTTDTNMTTYQHTILRSLKDYPISTLRVSGDINITAQVVGGVVGYQGLTSYIMDAGITLSGNDDENNSHLVAVKFYAGGVVGQQTSILSRVFAEHETETQNAIENSIASYYNSGSATGERGVLDLFLTGEADLNYENIAVGGLVGYASAGELIVSYSKINAISPSSSFAGGVIGKIDTSGQLSYSVENGADPFQTNYLINEVYSTGDVRAKFDYETAKKDETTIQGTSGGIVGQICVGSRVSMLSVNAMNKFSTYDYQNDGEYQREQLLITTEAKFDNVGVYAIAGNVEDSKSLTFVQKVKTSDDDDVDVVGYASVGYVSHYSPNPTFGIERDLLVSAYPGHKQPVSTDVTAIDIFAITDYNDIQDSDAGYRITRGYFTGNAIWDIENWEHQVGTLYPSIRYSSAESPFVWLDAYDLSIGNALDQISKNPSVEVRVRGYIGENTTEVGNIDLRAYYKAHPTMQIPNDFYGRIVHNKEYINNQDVTPWILLDRPFVEVMSKGFSIENVYFKFTNVGGYDSGLFANSSLYSGAIVNGTMNDGGISGLTVQVDNTVYLNGETVSNANGLVAAKMSLVGVNGIQIINNCNGSDVLKVSANNAETGNKINIQDELNVGLIAGDVISTSEKIISIDNVVVNNQVASNNLISFNDNVINYVDTLNLGAYFGKISVANNQNYQQLNYTIQGFDYKESSKICSLYVNVNTGNLNAGGNVGTIEGKIGSNLGNNFIENYNIAVDVESAVDLQANIGLVVGNLASLNTSTWGSQTDATLLQGKMILNGELTNASIGVFAGNVENELTLTGVQAEVRYDSLSEKDYTSFNNDVIDNVKIDTSKLSDAIKLKGESSYGGLVGKAEAAVTIANISNEPELHPTTFNKDKNYPINIEVKEDGKANIGGLVGKASGNATISGYVEVKSVFNLQGEGKTTYGGLVGKAEGELKVSRGETPANDKTISKIVHSQVLLHSTGAFVGGIVGDALSSTTISQTAFAGAVKLYNGVTAANFGGSIAKAPTSKIVLQNNINYGDLINISANGLNSLNFAGFIAYLEGENKNVTASGNYSFVTNNNTTTIKNDSQQRALFNDNVASANLAENYYNHALSMALDNKGSEIAYNTQYGTKGYKGYGTNKKTDASLLSLVKGVNGLQLSFLGDDLNNEGTKLHPHVIDSDAHKIVYTKTTKDGETVKYNSTNGISYYVLAEGVNLSSDSEINSLFTLSSDADGVVPDQSRELDNIAVIGDSNTLTYTVKQSDSKDKLPPIIQNMKNYSFISGLNVQLEVSSENALSTIDNTSNIYGGLVNQMSGGKLFSVGVTGTISIGGTGYMSLGGLVGDVTGGMIDECNTSVNITYRGPSKNGDSKSIIGGLAAELDGTGVKVNKTYTSGALFSYTNANLYAIADGAGSELTDVYTIALTQIYDVTTAESSNDAVRSIYGTKTTYSNVAYTQKATGIVNESPNTNSYPTIKNTITISDWTKNEDYNYGYPIRQNLYTQPTSYYQQTTDQLECDDSRGIHRYVYKRVPVDELFGITVNKNTAARRYGIPNAEKLEEKIDQYAYSVLINDIDVKLTSLTVGAGLRISGKDFDGNGKSINNLSSTMFASIASSTVSNLRLVDAIIGVNDAALARSMTNSTINYVTAQGSINWVTNQSGNVGGIVNASTGGTIKNVTNLMSINGFSVGSVGGIVGNVASSTNIQYCNNSATIIINGNANVGGLVGSGSANIDTCYNAGGIAVNYNKDITSGEYYVGGLAGNTAGAINNSYNSGTVRAGTKNSQGMAYVGGIAGKFTSTITGCINDASVEARSVSTWSFDEEDKTNNTNFAYVYMLQGTQHLHVYGIGFADGGSAKITNSISTEKAQISPNGNALPDNAVMYAWSRTQDETTKTTLPEEAKYYDESKEMPVSGMGLYTYGKWFYGTNVNYSGFWWIGIPRFNTAFATPFNVSNIDYEDHYISAKLGYESENERTSFKGQNVNIVNYDNYGFPRSIDFTYSIYQSLRWYDIRTSVKKLTHLYNEGLDFMVDVLNGGAEQFSTSYYIGSVTIPNQHYYWSAEQLSKSVSRGEDGNTRSYTDIINFYGGTVSNVETTGTEVDTNNAAEKMQSILGQGTQFKGTSNKDDFTSIKIAGEDYYVSLDDSESLYNVLNSSAQIITFDLTYEGTENPAEIGARSSKQGISSGQKMLISRSAEDYSITFSESNTNFANKQNVISTLKIEKVDYAQASNILTLKVKLILNTKAEGYNASDWGNEKFDITCSYNREETIDFSNANYDYYTEDDDATGYKAGDIVIKTTEPKPENENPQSYFEKDSEGNFVEGNGELCHVKNDGKEYYLVYTVNDDGTGTYVYRRNIYLAQNESSKVNTENVLPDTFIGKTFAYSISTVGEPVRETIDVEKYMSTFNKATVSNDYTVTLQNREESLSYASSHNEEYGKTSKGESATNHDTFNRLIGYSDIQYSLNVQFDETQFAGDSEGMTQYIGGSKEDPVITLTFTKDVEGNITLTNAEASKDTIELMVNEEAVTFGVSVDQDFNITLQLDKYDSTDLAALTNALQSISHDEGLTLTFDSTSSTEITEEYFDNIKISYDLPQSTLKAAVALGTIGNKSGNLLVAKYEASAWSVLDNLNLTFTNTAGEETKIDVSIENDKLIFAIPQTVNEEDIALFENALSNLYSLVQTQEFAIDTENTNMGVATQQVSANDSKAVSYTYDRNYAFDFNGLNYSGDLVNVKASQTTGSGNVMLTVEYSLAENAKTTFTNDDFDILIGQFEYSGKKYTRTTTSNNLQITLNVKTDDYSYVTLEASAKKADGTTVSIKDKETQEYDGKSNIQLSCSDNLREFTVKYKILKSYLTLDAKAPKVTGDATETYNHTLQIDFDDFSAILSYTYGGEIEMSGEMYDKKVYVTYASDGTINWSSVETGDIILAYKDDKFYKYSDRVNIYQMISRLNELNADENVDSEEARNIQNALTGLASGKEEVGTGIYYDDVKGTKVQRGIIATQYKPDILYTETGTIRTDSITPKTLSAGYKLYYLYREDEDDPGEYQEILIGANEEDGKTTRSTVGYYDGDNLLALKVTTTTEAEDGSTTDYDSYYIFDYIALKSEETLLTEDGYVTDQNLQSFETSRLKDFAEFASSYIVNEDKTRVYFDNNGTSLPANISKTTTTTNSGWSAQIDMPSYGIDACDMGLVLEDVDWQILIGGENYKSFFDQSYSILEDGKTIQFKYKKHGQEASFANSLTVNIEGSETAQVTQRISVNANNKKSYTGVILDKDIVLNEMERIITLESNLIGNNHIFSYNQNNPGADIGFIKEVKSGVKVKDLMVVGQVQASDNWSKGGAIAYTNFGEWNHIGVYGNIRHISTYSNVEVAGIAISNNNTKMENINIDISIIGLDAASAARSNLSYGGSVLSKLYVDVKTGSKISELNYQGIIIAGNGGYGANGNMDEPSFQITMSGITEKDVDDWWYGNITKLTGDKLRVDISQKSGAITAGPGFIGGNGGAITMTSSADNKGIIKVGDYGATGHSGDGARSADFKEISAKLDDLNGYNNPFTGYKSDDFIDYLSNKNRSIVINNISRTGYRYNASAAKCGVAQGFTLNSTLQARAETLADYRQGQADCLQGKAGRKGLGGVFSDRGSKVMAITNSGSNITIFNRRQQLNGGGRSNPTSAYYRHLGDGFIGVTYSCQTLYKKNGNSSSVDDDYVQYW